MQRRHPPLSSSMRLHSALRTTPMDMPTSDFVLAGALAELRAKGRLVLHGRHSPILVSAALRLVVPWTHGFKGIKSFVRIRLVEQEQPPSWNRQAPQEYGFYAN